jgi:hypothetical protein
MTINCFITPLCAHILSSCMPIDCIVHLELTVIGECVDAYVLNGILPGRSASTNEKRTAAVCVPFLKFTF